MVRAEEQTVAGIASWYFGLVDKFPDVFSEKELYKYWSFTTGWGDSCIDLNKEVMVSNLRAGALKLLRAKVSKCKACPLHVHRLPGRPVLDDGSYTNDPFVTYDDVRYPIGATTAKIMMIAEGPGQFEQRTSTPFVSYQVLAGSLCAYECESYEKCYNSKSQLPQQPCKPVRLRKILPPDTMEQSLIQIRTTRATASPFPIMTVAGILDKTLSKAGLWRESWNGRQVLRDVKEHKARPGSIYLSNMVKCRSCKPRENGNGWEDETPSKENMDTCTPWLEMQIYIIQPQVIIAMGNPAIAGTTGISDPKVLSMRGNVYPGKFGLPVLCEVHPSYISRQSPKDQEGHIEHFIASLETAKKIVSGDYVLPWMNNSGTTNITETEFPSPSDMSFTDTFGGEDGFS